MISKQHKLTTKEINYLMRRKQSVYVGEYKILWCEQYANNLYHQAAIQVSGKIHKHAVQRNIIRRAFYAAREDQIDKAIHNHYYKVFVVVHPEHCEQIQQSIATESKRKEAKKINKSSDSSSEQSSEPSSDRPQIFGNLKHHFSQIITSSLGKLNQSSSKISSPKPKYSGANSQPKLRS